MCQEISELMLGAYVERDYSNRRSQQPKKRKRTINSEPNRPLGSSKGSQLSDELIVVLVLIGLYACFWLWLLSG